MLFQTMFFVQIKSCSHVIHLVLVEGLEMVFETNGKWVVALYLLAPKIPTQFGQTR